jgi:RimJ/RimL family protein N-acetyltransferase
MYSPTETLKIRPANEEDSPFIEQMCYEAAFPEGLGERPPFEEARQLEWFQKYTRDWPNHEGDFGLIAENASGKPVGAAWYRDYPREVPGEDIPTHELSIALVPEARGRQIGEELMLSLMRGASQRGVDRLALQVKDKNKRAKNLYQKLGFLTATTSEEGYDIMVAPTPLTIETDQEGLILRQMTTVEDDQDYLGLQNNNRNHIAEFGNTIDANIARVVLRRTEIDRVRFGIYKDGEIIGVEDYKISEDSHEAEVGILLAKDAEGHGYAMSALKALTAHIEPKFQRIFAEVDPNNKKSIRLFERIGYAPQEVLIQRGWGKAAVLEFKK